MNSCILCSSSFTKQTLLRSFSFFVKSNKGAPSLPDSLQKIRLPFTPPVFEITEQGAPDPLMLLHDKNYFEKISERVAEVTSVTSSSEYAWLVIENKGS